MSDEWHVHLVYQEGSSNKFWRARIDGTELVVNWGRIGTNGQSKTKSFGSADDAKSDMDKQANGKRKKGYDDLEGGASAPAEAAEAAPAAPKAERATLSFEGDGRKLAVEISVDGTTVKTSTTEHYPDAGAAKRAFERITEAMREDGYR